jgi:hypothetical protein
MRNAVEQIDAFFGDGKVQRLLNLCRETRALRVCFPREVPLSRFLAWIFDPSQGHGLQDMPLRRLLTAAGRNLEGLSLPLTTRRFLGATSLSATSFYGALVQKEVSLNGGGARLDVLILDPANQLVVAIENKAGAKTSSGQLDKYADALEKQYPSWHRVLIFMDMYGASPDDEAGRWIPLDYQWLTDEMHEAERAPWIGEESRAAIRDFRRAIDFEERPFLHVDEEGDDVLDVLDQHPEIFELMEEWSQSGDKPGEMLEKLQANTANLGRKALMDLYTAYWQRRDLWLQCLPMRRYAGWLQQIYQRFPDVWRHIKRTSLVFSLPQWEKFAEQGKDHWPLRVAVRILRSSDSDKVTYAVVSVLAWPLSPETLEEVEERALALRKTHLKRNRSLRDEQRRAKLRVDRTTDPNAVGGLIVKHLAMLDETFEGLLD